MTIGKSARVAWLDSPASYGVISRILHWAMAGLILWQILGMLLRLILGRQPVVGFFVGLHAPIGTLLFGLVVLRILWTVINRHRRPAYSRGMAGLAARLGHGALYALMVTIPAVALLRAYGNGRGFSPFGVTLFAPGGERADWMVNLASAVHGPAGWVLAVLVLGHAVAAILHQVLIRDDTLSRMAGRSRG